MTGMRGGESGKMIGMRGRESREMIGMREALCEV